MNNIKDLVYRGESITGTISDLNIQPEQEKTLKWDSPTYISSWGETLSFNPFTAISVVKIDGKAYVYGEHNGKIFIADLKEGKLEFEEQKNFYEALTKLGVIKI